MPNPWSVFRGAQLRRVLVLIVAVFFGMLILHPGLALANGPYSTVTPGNGYQFPTTPVGQSSTTTFTFQNTDYGTVTPNSISTGNPDFTVTQDTCSGQTLAAGTGQIPTSGGGTCTFNVTFSPSVATSSENAAIDVNYYDQIDQENDNDTTAVSGGTTFGTASPNSSPLAFGDQADNTNSALTETITNTGTANLNIGQASLTNNSAGNYGLDTDTCSNSTVTPNSTCTITIDFGPAPPEQGSENADLSIPSNDPNSPLVVSLTGFATTPEASLNPSPLNFGQITAGHDSTQTETITNNGNAALQIGSVSIANDTNSAYSLTNDTCSNSSVGAGNSCTVDITFSPAAGATGSETAELDFSSNNNPSQIDANLSGTAEDIEIAGPNSAQNFGNTAIGNMASQTIAVTNNGQDTGTVSAVTLVNATGGTPSPDYSITNDQCTGQTVAANASCPVTVSYTPSSNGSSNVELRVSSNSTTSPTQTELTGYGTTTSYTLTPSSNDFGSTRVGSTSSDQLYTVNNTGNVPITINSAAVTGPFQITNDQCSNTAVSGGTSCTFDANYQPTMTGADTGTITVTTGNAGNQTSSVSGTGVASDITLNPTSLDFGNVTVGATATEQTVTVTNPGSDSLNIGQIGFEGTQSSNPNDQASSDFSLINDQCSNTALSPNTSCTFQVSVKPSATGSLNNALEIPSDASEGVQTLPVSATGVAPAVTPTGALSLTGSGTIAPVAIGASGQQVLTLTNSGSAPVAISSVTIGGNNPNEFSLTTDSCANTTIAAHSSCTIVVAASPSAAGSQSAELTINSANGAVTTPLSVIGTSDGSLLVSPTRPVFHYHLNRQHRETATVTVTNPLTAPVTITNLTVNNARFQASQACAKVLAPNASCTIKLSFIPNGKRLKVAHGRLSVTGDGQPLTVSLTAHPAINITTIRSNICVAFVKGAHVKFSATTSPRVGAIYNLARLTGHKIPTRVNCYTPIAHQHFVTVKTGRLQLHHGQTVLRGSVPVIDGRRHSLVPGAYRLRITVPSKIGPSNIRSFYFRIIAKK